jgi:acyl carrier protein
LASPKATSGLTCCCSATRRNRDKPHLGADSLDIVELCMAAEDEFGLELPDDEIEKLNGATFGELVDFIHAKREARS